MGTDQAEHTTTTVLQGLDDAQAAQRLKRYGPNEAPQPRTHPLLAMLSKLWAPVPWMLEVTIALELLLGRYLEAAVIGALLVFNAILGFVQENRANNALALLRQRLSVQTRVLRNGVWRLLAARELVPDDVVHVRMGDIAPADLRLASGQVELDQSALTGESLPVEAGPGQNAYAGTVVKRGEATGQVIATGTRTSYGKTAELVSLARTRSHLESIIFRIIKYLVAMDLVLVALVLAYGLAIAMPLRDILPFALILLVASVPVALPAMFTVATALGALELAHQGVLVTRLSAIEEAAGMDILFSDKTGTITLNQLAVAAVRPAASEPEPEVLRLAALASDESTQDPIDLAIFRACRDRGIAATSGPSRRFVPFDPATKRSEAWVQQDGTAWRIVKGAVQAVAPLAVSADDDWQKEAQTVASGGVRVLAVVAGPPQDMHPIGLIGLRDPPREDSADLVHALQQMGVRLIMVTGDALPTALAVADIVGIGSRAGDLDAFRRDPAHPLDCDVLAGVLPEDKYHLVQASQHGGHITGMTGDGVNDAPALKQAEVGIAVASATDVAKAAASIVLTTPGIGNIVAAEQTSRRIYQRMLTYTLNKIIKTCEIALLLSVGLIVTGVFVTTPTLIVLLLFTNDFVTMSIATDRVSFSPKPTRWHVRALVRTALSMAGLILLLSFAIFFTARNWLPLPQLQTLIFLMLVFSGQGTVYLVREHRHFWASVPSRWMLVSSLLDIVIVSIFAIFGIFMAPLAMSWIGLVLLTVLAYLTAIDFLKTRIMRYVQ